MKKKKDSFDALLKMMREYGEACRADEMKGGGDPLSIPEIEAYLTFSWARVVAQVDRLKRQYEG